MMGLPSDAAIWRFAHAGMRGWFPALSGEWNFVRRCANLHGMKQAILGLRFRPGRWSVFDGLPLPVCQLGRAMRDRCFQGEAAKSFCAAKNEPYYGFSWLRVSGTTERPEIDQCEGHQLHAVMPLLFEFKAQQNPLELIFPRKGALHA